MIYKINADTLLFDSYYGYKDTGRNQLRWTHEPIFSPDGTKVLFRSNRSYAKTENYSSINAKEAPKYLSDLSTGEITEVLYGLDSYSSWIDNQSFLYTDRPDAVWTSETTYSIPWDSGRLMRYNIATGSGEIMYTGISVNNDLDKFMNQYEQCDHYYLFRSPENDYGLLDPLTGKVNMTGVNAYYCKPSPDGQLIAHTPDSATDELFILDMDTKEEFRISDKLDGKLTWAYTWLDGNILAVAAHDADAENRRSNGVINMGKYLYVFRIG